MADQHSPINYTSADFEKAALTRFRSLVSFVPNNCKLFRELWNRSTVLCLDFENCPNVLEQVMGQSFLLLLVAHYLGLADSILFRKGKKVIGWMSMIA